MTGQNLSASFRRIALLSRSVIQANVAIDLNAQEQELVALSRRIAFGAQQGLQGEDAAAIAERLPAVEKKLAAAVHRK